MSTRSRSEKLADIWQMTTSPVRLGDARLTWSHENASPTKDARPSIVKLRENHKWVDRRIQLVEELETGKGKDVDYVEGETLIVPLSHWKNKKIHFERDLADELRNEHHKKMSVYIEKDKACIDLEQTRADLHDKLTEEEFLQADHQRKRLLYAQKIRAEGQKKKMIEEQIENLQQEYQDEFRRTGIAKMEADYFEKERKKRNRSREGRHCCTSCCTFCCYHNPEIRRECRKCKCQGHQCCNREWLDDNLDPYLVLMDWARYVSTLIHTNTSIASFRTLLL